ncbi:MAG: hypothetical protein MJ180_00245 [Candidatus Gastranaerophilales bacterium]|nr:hypothetical protein [Candidatus Gastranaerophilales bacterium]
MAEAIEGLKIGVGTKVDDVYADKEAFDQARVADKNGDHVIDQDELNRYVGPVFAETVTTKEGRILGSVSGIAGSRRLSAVLLKDSEVDYYPGLTFEKTKDGRDMKTFADIDLDGNKSLSKEEIVLYGKKRDANQLKKTKDFIKKSFMELISFSAGAGIGLAAFGGIALLLGAGMSGIVVPLVIWGLVCGIPSLVGLIDYMSAKSKCDKRLNELEPQIEKESSEILSQAKKAA